MKSVWMKMVWLVCGLMVGVGLSSTIANTREPASYRFKVLAVSAEDAAERAEDLMREPSFRDELNTDRVVSASRPECREEGLAYACATRLVYRR